MCPAPDAALIPDCYLMSPSGERGALCSKARGRKGEFDINPMAVHA